MNRSVRRVSSSKRLSVRYHMASKRLSISARIILISSIS
jgi:hypothetical protein